MEKTNEEKIKVDEEDEEEEESTSKLSLFLNKYFHHLDRGSTLKNEIISGIFVGIIAVCALFMNMQAIAQTLVKEGMSNDEIANLYAGIYFISTLIACVGSLLIGVIARLPLIQTTGLGIGALFISTIGSYNGLTYYNLLAVTFVSAIIYALLVSVPVVKKFVFKAIPKSVLKALPAAAGVLVCFIALQLSGIITIDGSGFNINQFAEINGVSSTLSIGSILNFGDYSSDVYKPYILLGFISALITLVAFIVFNGIKKRSGKHCKNPLWLALLVGTLFFLAACAITSFSELKNWGRLWLVGGTDAYGNHVSSNAMTLSIGKVFEEGFDFSEFVNGGGNVASLFVGGILTYVFIGLFDAQASLEGVAADVADAQYKDVESFSYKNNREIATICNAGINVFAAILGVPPVSISKESIASTKDGAKSGISSIVAAIVIGVSAFVWVIPFLFATYTATGNIAVTSMYGQIGSGTLEATANAAFCVADMIMAIVGVMMVSSTLARFDFSSALDGTTFVVVILVTLFTSNIAYGALCGVIIYCLGNLILIKKNEEGKVDFLDRCGIPTIVLAVLGVVTLVFAL